MGILISMCPRDYFVDSENLKDVFGEANWVEIGKIPTEEDDAGKEAVTSGEEVSREKGDEGRKKNEISGPVNGKEPKGCGDEAKLKKTDEGSRIGSFDEDVSFGLNDQPSVPAAKVVDEENQVKDGGEKLTEKEENPKSQLPHQKNEVEKEVGKEVGKKAGANEGSESPCTVGKKAKGKSKKKNKQKRRKKVVDPSLPNEAKDIALSESQQDDAPRCGGMKKKKCRPLLKRAKANLGRQIQYLSPAGKGGGKVGPASGAQASASDVTKALYSEHVIEMFEGKPSKPPTSVDVLSVENEEESIKGRCEFAVVSTVAADGESRDLAGTAKKQKSKWAKLKFWKAARETRVVEVDRAEWQERCWDENLGKKTKEEKASKKKKSRKVKVKVKSICITAPKPSEVYRKAPKVDEGGDEHLRQREAAKFRPGKRIRPVIKIESNKEEIVYNESCVI